jgi:nuclear receptor interaction protein
MAVSGIDHTIKIFSPDILLQRNARRGIGVQSSDPLSFSSLSWDRRRRAQAAAAAAAEVSTRTSSEGVDDSESDSSDEEVAAGGLSSKKRFHQAYEITSKNDMERKGGREDYFISRTVLAQIARHIAAQQAGGGGVAGEDGDNGPIVVSEDNCAVM